MADDVGLVGGGGHAGKVVNIDGDGVGADGGQRHLTGDGAVGGEGHAQFRGTPIPSGRSRGTGINVQLRLPSDFPDFLLSRIRCRVKSP